MLGKAAKPRKSYYVKKADRAAAEQAVQKAFAFGDGDVVAEADVSRTGGLAGETAVYSAIEQVSRMTDDQRALFLDAFHPGALLESLRRHGGTLQACADAQLLVLKKSADYNNTGNKATAHTFKASRDDYFPFGLKSYAQMIHTKSQRLLSLALKDGGSNFESARDTMLDLINYASFGADWLDREDRQYSLMAKLDEGRHTEDSRP